MLETASKEAVFYFEKMLKKGIGDLCSPVPLFFAVSTAKRC